MNVYILDLVTKYLCLGHAVTVGHPTSEGRDFLWKHFNNIVGAKYQVINLMDYVGTTAIHTPVVVLFDARKANHVLLPEARAVACSFPNGDPPILIEC